MSPFVNGGPELDNLHVFILALAFYDAKVWAQGSGDKSVTETKRHCPWSEQPLPAMTQVTCPCLLPPGMKDASQPAQGCMVTPMAVPTYTHTRTPCMCPHSHPCMHAHPHAHTHTAQCCMLHSTSKSGNVPASGWVRGIMLAHKLGLPFHPSVVERFKWNVRISFPNIVFQ